VVTLLTPLLLELDAELMPEPELEFDVELEPEDPELLVVVVVVVLGVEATVVADEAVEAFRASAGSCPETRTRVIISQAATNSATAPEITRRRIVRARAARSARSAWPRARAASLWSVSGGVMGPASSRAVSST
jgi:hypothetical protein